MANFEDILKNRKKSKKYTPKKQRSWDYIKDGNECIIGTNTPSSGNDTGNKVGTNTPSSGNKVGTNTPSSENDTGKKLRKIIFHLSNINGIQKDILAYIFETKSKDNKGFIVQLNTSQASQYLNLNIESFRVSLRRLEKKEILIRLKGSSGRYGFTVFKIPNYVIKNFSAPIYNSNITTINKNNKKEENQNNLINPIKQPQSIQTQKTEPVVTDYSSEWDNLDLSPLESNGMKKSHIQQLKNIEGLTPDLVQESINHYSWALDNDPERMKRYAPKQNQLKGLMGCLKKGNPWTEGEYIDPIEEAMQKSIEAKKKRIERLKAQKEEMFNLEYEEWEMSLSVEEKTALKKKLNIVTMRGGGYKAQMRTHFRDNIYKG